MMEPGEMPTGAVPVLNSCVRIVYTNWRGETRPRLLSPIRLWWGRTEWHPEPQWLLSAIDVEDGNQKDFSMLGISSWGKA